jgi:hypothetical protein
VGLKTRLFGIAALCALVAATALSANAGLGYVAVHHRMAGTGRFDDTLVSSNWAGYAVTSADPTLPYAFTAVSATWKQPAVSCGRVDSNSASAFWVGIGGYDLGSQKLEQIGTESDCNQLGPPSYYGWYELVPGPPLSFAMHVQAGDMMSASVTVSKTNLVTLTLKNLTRHTVAIERQTFVAPDLSSAEWVAEAPTECSNSNCSMVPLANFGAVSMTKLSATGNGQAGALTNPLWTATPIQLVTTGSQQFYAGPDQGNVSYSSTAGTCTPTNVAGDGGSFTVSWTSAAQQGC